MKISTETEEVLPPVAPNFVEQALAIARRSGIRSPSSPQIERSAPPQQPNQPSVAPQPESSQPTVDKTVQQRACQTGQSVSYFKDAIGNEYRMKDGNLFMKGWKDVESKVRVVSEKTGKEIPLSGKKVQVFGWIMIKSADEDDIEDVTETGATENEQ